MEENVKPARDERGRLLPGNTANPNGRPKRKTFAEYFNEIEVEDLINKIKQALKGEKTDKEITKMVVEQIFGKPKQPLVGGDEEDKPISILTNVSNNQRDSSNTETEKED